MRRRGSLCVLSVWLLVAVQGDWIAERHRGTSGQLLSFPRYDHSCGAPLESPSPSPASESPSSSPVSDSPSVTPSPSISDSSSVSGSQTPSVSGTSSVTPSLTPSVSSTSTATPSPTSSATPTRTTSTTPSVSATLSPSNTATPSVTSTPSVSATSSVTPSVTPTTSVTPSVSSTSSTSPSVTRTSSRTPSVSATPTISDSSTISISATASRTPVSASLTPTISDSSSITPTISDTSSITPSHTPTPSPGDGKSCYTAISIELGQSILGDITLEGMDETQARVYPCHDTMVPLYNYFDWGGSVTEKNGIWYKIIGTGQPVLLNTCLPGTNAFVSIIVMNGTCAPMPGTSSLVCQQANYYDYFCDCCEIYYYSPYRTKVWFVPEPGLVYYVYVEGKGSWLQGGRGQFILEYTLRPPSKTRTASVSFTRSSWPSVSMTASASPSVSAAPVCNPPMTPLNGSVVCEGLNFNQQCEFSCDAGFWLTGPSNRTCVRPGVWSGSILWCQRSYCPALSFEADYLVVSPGGHRPVGGSVTVSCDASKGFAAGTVTRNCLASSVPNDVLGVWDDTSLPSCATAQCPANGGFPATAGGAVAMLPCQGGLTGQILRRCFVGGTWDAVRDNCIPIPAAVVAAETPAPPTLDQYSLAAIVVGVLGCCCIVLLAALLLFYRRRKRKREEEKAQQGNVMPVLNANEPLNQAGGAFTNAL